MPNKSVAETRLQELMKTASIAKTDLPKFDPEKFLWVFGNMIQEYMADRLYENVKNEKDIGVAIKKGLEIATTWFGKDDLIDWPFHRSWLKEYINGRFLGPRLGKSAEYTRDGGRNEFLKRYPITGAICQWYLGCSNKENLEVDHKHAWKIYGASSPENFQWLCKKHNNEWKKTLLFWGDNFIPFRKYMKENQPR